MKKITATVHFDGAGVYYPVLDRQITFTTINGAKRALHNIISRHMDNLKRFYPRGTQINVECYMSLKVPFLTAKITI